MSQDIKYPDEGGLDAAETLVVLAAEFPELVTVDADLLDSLDSLDLLRFLDFLLSVLLSVDALDDFMIYVSFLFFCFSLALLLSICLV